MDEPDPDSPTIRISSSGNKRGDTRTGPPPSPSTPPDWEPPSPQEVSAMLGGYVVTGILGRGGMGAVYKGIQTSLERKVAIKLLPPELGTDPEFEERFRREAKSMASLNHPNIVHIHDFGQVPGGYHFIVMEYVEGTDLHRLIHGGELSPEEALKAVGQICDALEYAHGEGYVHRDIKPANIFLDRHRNVKVGDFGLAKLIDENAEEPGSAGRPDLTSTGMTVGTPLYVAPEQLREGVKVDRRADIYSLGVMFYEMLTGEIPRGAVKPPSKLNDTLDQRVDAVVFKAMDPNPDDRYQSATALRADVEAIRTIPGEKEPPADSAAKTVPAAPAGEARNRGVLRYAVVGLVALLVAGLVFALTRNGAGGGGGGNGGNPKGSGKAAIRATKGMPFENTLGMLFVPVPITGGPTDGETVFFSKWETRRRDFRPFVEETERDWPEAKWESEGFVETDDHPAVMVSWEDADAYCRWLTERERKAGKIGDDYLYRLPSDHEWSCAIGIGDRENPSAEPRTKHLKVKDVFPWGSQWPPPDDAGNWLGTETESLMLEWMVKAKIKPVPGYDDGYPRTAPAGTYANDVWGIHDLSGNAEEWTGDWNGNGKVKRTLRGGSWRNYHRDSLLSSNRSSDVPHERFASHGFRCVLVREVGR